MILVADFKWIKGSFFVFIFCFHNKGNEYINKHGGYTEDITDTVTKGFDNAESFQIEINQLFVFTLSLFVVSVFRFLSVDLNKLRPLRRRPHPIFLHVARRRLPVPAPHRDAPGGAVVRRHVVERLAWNANFQLQKLGPAQRETREDVPDE